GLARPHGEIVDHPDSGHSFGNVTQQFVSLAADVGNDGSGIKCGDLPINICQPILKNESGFIGSVDRNPRRRKFVPQRVFIGETEHRAGNVNFAKTRRQLEGKSSRSSKWQTTAYDGNSLALVHSVLRKTRRGCSRPLKTLRIVTGKRYSICS